MTPLLLAAAMLAAGPTFAYLGQSSEGLGGFTIRLEEGWTAKLPGGDVAPKLRETREPEFLGPRDARLHVDRLLAPSPELLKATIQELGQAEQRNSEGFRPLHFRGRHGGLYLLVRKHGNTQPYWEIAKMTLGKELFSLVAAYGSKPRSADLDRLEAMIRSLEPYPTPSG
ncbi:MAG: hypothetical protein HYR64_04035 [Fimbriimonas ginsengisoli]|uniref:DUF1795 domain-containing protein n=1 Tax=Fimbriimonas ginsengisoli TaxID=1005039 RepID=A0A931LRR1_FIMGI|nr:hypothetical protein [Fimbriimonas ginsengisoli]